VEIIVELVFELLFQFLLQFVGEVLVGTGFEGAARVLENRIGRMVAATIVAVAGGFGAGWWWGDRYASTLGTSDVPTSLFVSIGFALGFAVLTGISAIREFRAPDPTTSNPHPAFLSADRWLPWRWPPGRLAAFALLNASIAIGITVGFTPEQVRLR
jgi:hypothetical protein